MDHPSSNRPIEKSRLIEGSYKGHQSITHEPPESFAVSIDQQAKPQPPPRKTGICSSFVDFYVTFWEYFAMQTRGTLIILLVTAAAFAVAEAFEVDLNLNWAFVSIAIVFPLTATIQMAFQRRERATQVLADVLALIHCLSLAHRDWKQKEELPGHLDRVNGVLHTMTSDLEQLITGPRAIARDNHCVSHSKEIVLQKMADRQIMLTSRFVCGIRTLSKLTEAKKAAGMPANEASRISQYIYILNRDFYLLRDIKFYRTPNMLRSMSRFFIVVTPVMFSPYFRYVRIHSNWTFASLFAGFVTFALVTLLHVVDQVEDPFDHQFGGASVSNMYYKQSRSDDVKVHTVFAEARATLGLDEEMVLAAPLVDITDVEYEELD